MNNVDKLKEILTPFDIGHSKIHLGPQYDGGYVISQDCLEKTDAVYSLGIGGECDFDLDLANRGFQIYQYEAFSEGPPKHHNNFHFTKMFMNGQNFKTEIVKNRHIDSSLFLSMDIEGGEYDLLNLTPESLLKCFNQICFEIHDVLYNPNIFSLLNKITSQFILIHIHANNNCIRPGAYSSGIFEGLPNVLELTYVNRELIKQDPKIQVHTCPINNLDFKNQPDLPEVTLNWWVK